GLRAGFRESEVLDLALLDQIFDRSGDVFDRHVRVDAMLVEQIDAVGAKPLERSFGYFLDVFWATVDAGLFAVLNLKTELRCDLDLIAEWSESFTDEFFVGEWSVDLGGIAEGHSTFHGGAYEVDALLLLYGWTETKAQAHATESEGGYFEIP